MADEELKRLLEESIKDINFKIVEIEGKEYYAFDNEQMKKFFETISTTLWKGLMEIIKKQQNNNRK